MLKLPIWLLKQVLPFNNGSINVQGQSLTGSGTPRHLGSQELRQAPTPLSTLCCSLVLPLRRAQASPDPCTQLACTLSPQGAFFFSCCSNRQSPPESWGSHCSRVLRKLARPSLGKAAHPKCSVSDIFQSLKMYCSQLFYDQNHCQGNPRILISLVPSPCRERLAPGPEGLRTVPTLCRPLIPSRAPFLSHPLSPSASSSSNTNCLHGKSPSMTRFSTHKRKLWATDPTS